MKKSSKGFKNLIVGIVSAVAAVFIAIAYRSSKLFHRKKVTEHE